MVVSDNPVFAVVLDNLNQHPSTCHPVCDGQRARDKFAQRQHRVADVQHRLQPLEHAPRADDAQKLEQPHQPHYAKYLELLDVAILRKQHAVRIFIRHLNELLEISN
jgi:hypothetical protein